MEVFRVSNSKAILWIIGDTIADFSNRKILLLYWDGGVWKGSIVNIIIRTFVGNIPSMKASDIPFNF